MVFSLKNARTNLPNTELSVAPLPSAAPAAINPFAPTQTTPSATPERRMRDDGAASSIIGHDLELRGTDIQIIVSGKLRVDGKIAGEVYGKEIVIGRDAHVSGRIVAEKIDIHGTVSSGEIFANQIALMSGAQVNAELHHRMLVIEEGAQFDGRSRRSSEDSTLPSPGEKAAAA